MRGMIRQPQPAPAMPSELFVAAAAIPAQKVPWKPTSMPDRSAVYSGSGSLSPIPKSHPSKSSISPLPSSSSELPAISPGLCQIWLARSGCVTSTPVSMIAITVEGSPRSRSQASGRLTSAKPLSSTYH